MTGWPIFRRRKSSDLEDEIQAHLAMATRDFTERGETSENAAYAARREFGNVTLVKEVTRGVWGSRLFESLGQDLRYAFRSLRGSPMFALVAISSLALGIGANTAIFSFVKAILLTHLPVPDPDQLVQISEDENGRVASTVFSLPFIEELNKRDAAFDGILGRFRVRVNLATGDSAEPLNGEVITGDYYRTLRLKPALGRLLTAEDTDAGITVCVISYSLWQERFAGDPGVIGRKIMLNAHPYTVVGVTGKGFYGPQLQSRIDLQLPVSRIGDFMGGYLGSAQGGNMWKSVGFSWLEPIARLKRGITVARAQAMTDPLARSIWTQLATRGGGGGDAKPTFRLTDGSQGAGFDSEYSKPVSVLMAVVALVLLIACANLANLLLARANARAKECAVRLSLGASRARLVRQFMMESLLLSFIGGIVGIGLAYWIIQTLLLFVNAGQTSRGGIDASLDTTVIAFSIVLCVITAALFGLVPALQSTRPDVMPELKGTLDKQTAKVGGIGIRRGLIVFQIAVSVVIVFAAGLLTQTLSRLKTVDLGFQPERVITMRMDPAMNGFSPVQGEQLFDEIVSRLRAQPAVAAASLAVISPLDGSMISLDVEVPGHVVKSSERQTNFNMVSPGYFKTLNQRMLAGRDFNERDGKNAPSVAIVNRLFAEQYMPGLNPIGRRFKMGKEEVEIVGLVQNSRYQYVREEPWPLIYLPAKQTQNSGYALLVRTRMEPAKAIADIEHTIHSVAPRLPLYDVLPLEESINAGISAERILSFLSTLFSALATLLCVLGIYGAIAYAVSRRTREIGVRFAIGAQKKDVTRLFLRESAILVAAGILAGIPLALASSRVLTSLLYGVLPGDPGTLMLAIAVFIVAGLAASTLPVLKAARIDPVRALRYE